MHDIAFVRSHPDAFDAALVKRGVEPAAELILTLDARRREALTEAQQAQSRRNEASKAIGQAMAKSDIDTAEALKAEVGELKTSMPALEEKAKEAQAELDTLLASLPNLPADDVPEGADEASNREIASWGDRRSFDFEPKEHADIGPALGMEFDTAAAMSGARFTFLRGPIARLHRALAQFMLDRQTGERGYIECNPPLLVRDEALFGTGQLPKFEEDQFQTYRFPPKMRFRSLDDLKNFHTSNVASKYVIEMDAFVEHNELYGDPDEWPREWKIDPKELKAIIPGHWLIPTSEVSLTNSVREQILENSALPKRLTAHTPCFRSEAGSAGRDTRGFIRQHQFEKVELVSICRPEEAEAEHSHMLESAEAILRALDLPYRTMLLCAGDMGFSARKTFDLEVWLPGQQAYREISSVSWCGDFQARRMDARYRPEGEKKTAFVHTLNGSGLAVGRTLVAVMENYQQADGGVAVPAALAPYMGGIERIEALP